MLSRRNLPARGLKTAPVIRLQHNPKLYTCVPRINNVARAAVTSEAPPAPSPNGAPANPVPVAPVYTEIGDKSKQGRPRIVVLGSGWGAISFIKALPSNISSKYEVILVSPRNYFLYTPLLPAVATGTMEERSIVEAVRTLLKGKGDFYEAACQYIDPIEKEIVCCFPDDQGAPNSCFQVSYDILVVSVGSVNNTFGIQGVDKYCFFFKNIEDANRVRSRISECFERASLPAIPEAERRRLLSFVIVGGGPTGVEVAAEIHDMIYQDLVKLYPALVPEVQIRVIELMDHVLSTYDRAISDYTSAQFKRSGIQLVLNSRVAGVDDGVVTIDDKVTKQTVKIPFGACIWATGIAKNPLIQQLQTKLPSQTHFRSILTDEMMCVKGSNGSIFAIGDAATIDQPKALAFAEQLFEQFDINKNQLLSLDELRQLFKTASKQFSHLEEHARFVSNKKNMNRWGGMVRDILERSRPAASEGDVMDTLATYDEETELSKEDFNKLLASIDNGLRALPATAQVAKQQGEFLASLFKTTTISGKDTAALAGVKPFKYSHKGSAAYVGGDNAVFDVPRLGPLTGRGAGFVWKSFETYSQFSFRNQCLVLSDWLRTKAFGRDISRF